jgi:hypothetical protein
LGELFRSSEQSVVAGSSSSASKPAAEEGRGFAQLRHLSLFLLSRPSFRLFEPVVGLIPPPIRGLHSLAYHRGPAIHIVKTINFFCDSNR